MDQLFDFRSLLLKLQDCLSDNDRRRLHFLVGDMISRQIRDDPSLCGTLNLLDSLFDQARINEQDFDYLIHAFSEIRCHDAVKRLKEHQKSQCRRPDQDGTIVTVLINNTVEDKITYINARESTTIEDTTATSDPQSNGDRSHMPNVSVKSEEKEMNIYLTYIKQSIKSRLTACQLALFILNIVGIITLILIVICMQKRNKSSEELILIKVGLLHGNGLGGDSFNDAQDCWLTFEDRVTGVKAGWTEDEIDYATFTYSNGQSKQHDRTTYRETAHTYQFQLNPNERIDAVTVYTGIRLIVNPFQPNETFLVVGLSFRTDQGRQSESFGSSNATEIIEYLPNYALAYARGQALGYVDALQVIWSRETSKTTTAILSAY